MIRAICKDEEILAKKSRPATKKDREIGEDLKETLLFYPNCAGMAANMIGELKNIIVLRFNEKILVMYNPKIVQAKKPYETEEGCLSLEGVRPAKRYEEIVVEYQNERFQKKKERFVGFPAQIIQHEVDHLNGILI